MYALAIIAVHNVTMIGGDACGVLCICVQAVRPELADKDEHEDQTGLESLMEGDQKHHTQLPGTTTNSMCACNILCMLQHVHVVTLSDFNRNNKMYLLLMVQ